MTYHHTTNEEFLANIKHSAGDLHAVPAEDENSEARFSWAQCDLCRSQLGGDRHEAALIDPGTDMKPILLSVCVDCLVYLANGDLPHRM